MLLQADVAANSAHDKALPMRFGPVGPHSIVGAPDITGTRRRNGAVSLARQSHKDLQRIGKSSALFALAHDDTSTRALRLDPHSLESEVYPMLSNEKQVVSPTRALESISKRCHVSQSEVTQLYERELADLGADARVASFLPIFAMRNVEEKLHRRADAGRAA